MDPVIIGALIGAVVTPVVAWFFNKSKSEKRAKVKYVSFAIIAGIGETGKSTLIESLFTGVDAGANARTQVSSVYQYERSIPGEVNSYCRTYLFDYRGQDASQISIYFKKENDIGTPSAFILVVDPCIEGNPGDNLSIDLDRINLHKSQWSETSLSVLSGLFRDVKYACLFINKIDALSPSEIQKLNNEFKDIIDNLSTIFTGIQVEPLLGSALEGTKVSHLQEKIFETRRGI